MTADELAADTLVVPKIVRNQPRSDACVRCAIALPKSGGTVTLSGSINIFELVGDERELVFALIDLMREFEAKGGAE